MRFILQFQQLLGTYVTERSTHDDGLVTVLLIVVENLLDRLNTRVLFASVVGAGLVLLVPVEDTADEGRNEGGTGLGTSNRLTEAKEESEVAVDTLLLEFACSLDTLPGGRDLDQDAILGNTKRIVKCNEGLGFGFGALLVEGEACIDLSRHTARHNLQDFLAKLDELCYKRVDIRDRCMRAKEKA
jgi:hypothetical protein